MIQLDAFTAAASGKLSPTDFWAKLSDGTKGIPAGWLPVKDHAADVAACAEALLKQTLLGPRLARLGNLERLSEGQVARIGYLAALHDMGKFNHGFQNKRLHNPPFTAGHVREVMALFSGQDYEVLGRLSRALPLDFMQKWTVDPSAIGALLMATICHHGRPYVPDGTHYQARYWSIDGGIDPIDGLAELEYLARTWFPAAFASDTEPLPSTVPFQHGLSGLMMLADWIGSDSGRFFPLSNGVEQNRMVQSRNRARQALVDVGLDVDIARISLGPRAPAFQMVSDKPNPRPVQRAVMDLPIPAAGNLVLVEAATGVGKTEAALIRYLALMQSGEVDGLYFALPTRTAATQIYQRVTAAVRRAFPNEDHRPPTVLAVPGYLIADGVAARGRLTGFEVLWDDDPNSLMRYRGWAAENSKRYLAGAVVVGTIDQVLLSSLRVNHAHLRATSLLRHLLVVDEVHASDAYMTRLLERVLGFHLRAGGHALLLSATLGSEARGRLFVASGIALPPMDLAEARRLPYPLVSHGQVGAPANAVQVIETEPDKIIHVQLTPVADDPTAVADLALNAAARGARVLVVRNTVRDAVSTQLALEAMALERGLQEKLWTCVGRPATHHARFAKEDRELLDQRIEVEFGQRRPGGGLVAIATQTIQQSLDLDADLMLSDLCPMDILLQRAGRLHRHWRDNRAEGFRSACLIVLTPAERDLGPRIGLGGRAFGRRGIGTVYDDLCILEATWRELEKRPRLAIPTMNRDLVELTTHSEALAAIVNGLGGRWSDHWVYIRGKEAAQKGLGSVQTLDRDTDVFGQFAYPDQKDQGVIGTRLSEETDRRAVFDQPPIGPFGQAVAELQVRGFQAQGVPADTEPVLLEQTEIGFTFLFGAHTFLYHRLGLELVTKEEASPTDEPDAT